MSTSDIESSNFLKNYGTLIIAIIALVQVWMIALWKWLFRKGKVEVYETGNIEVGYGNWGASIALMGTLRSINKSVFITAMRITLTRKKDNAQQLLKWRIARSCSVSISTKSPESFEFASGVSVSLENPLKYNIFLSSDRFISDYNPRFQPIAELWQNFLQDHFKKKGITSIGQITTQMADAIVAEDIFSSFLKEKDILQLYSALERDFYWNEGEYRLDLYLDRKNISNSPVRSWKFSLQAKDVENLRLNIISLFRELCGLKTFYHRAYPKYEDTTS